MSNNNVVRSVIQVTWNEEFWIFASTLGNLNICLEWKIAVLICVYVFFIRQLSFVDAAMRNWTISTTFARSQLIRRNARRSDDSTFRCYHFIITITITSTILNTLNKCDAFALLLVFFLNGFNSPTIMLHLTSAFNHAVRSHLAHSFLKIQNCLHPNATACIFNP